MTERERLSAGVLAVAFNDEGKLLLTKRNEPANAEAHEHWQLPGGALEFGEHPEETMRREVQEELQLVDVVLLRAQPIVRTITFTERDSADMEIACQLLMFAYLVSLTGEANIDQDPEATECAWFTYAELENLQTLPLVKGIVEEAKTIWDQVKD